MTKQNKILLGLGIAGFAAAYLIGRRKKLFSNFTTADYNSCVETETGLWNSKVQACMAEGSTKEQCCAQLGGQFNGKVCVSPTDIYSDCCAKLGGTKGAGNLCEFPVQAPTCAANEVLVNGVCKPKPTTPPQYCGENEVLVNETCTCPTGFHWVVDSNGEVIYPKS